MFDLPCNSPQLAIIAPPYAKPPYNFIDSQTAAVFLRLAQADIFVEFFPVLIKISTFHQGGMTILGQIVSAFNICLKENSVILAPIFYDTRQNSPGTCQNIAHKLFSWNKQTVGIFTTIATFYFPSFWQFETLNMKVLFHLLCRGSAKYFRFSYLYWFGNKVIYKPINPEVELQNLVHFGRTTNCLFNHHYPKVFNTEVKGTFTIHNCAQVANTKWE